MKYRELLALLNDLSAEQLDMDVVVYDTYTDEVFVPAGFDVGGEEESALPSPEHTLDDHHPYLVVAPQ